MVKFESSWSTAHNSESAVIEASQYLKSRLDTQPSLIIAYATDPHDPDVIQKCLNTQFEGVPIHGGSSCIGTMTQTGFHSHDGYSLSLLALVDPRGDYGVGSTQVGVNPRLSGAEAIDAAIAASGRYGEPPELIWISGMPGVEEQIILGIQDIVGNQVPIIGGSSADNSVSGRWFQFCQEQILRNGVVVTAMYPSVATHLAFHSGYSTTKTKGIVTKANGRLLEEINGRPAAQVYNEWTGGLINEFMQGGNILARTTLSPLARHVKQVGNTDFLRLSHPETATDQGGLTLFTNIEEGEELILMAGSRESLIQKAGSVAQFTLDLGHISADDVSGALFIYGAGCMLTVQDGMYQIAERMAEVLNQAPFVGAFAFGEQGSFINGGNYHGNLMISMVVFEK